MTWTAWRLYDRHCALRFLSAAREVATVADGNIASMVEAMRPSRFITALVEMTRGLVEVAARPELPAPFRAAVLEFANYELQEAVITQWLAPTAAEVNAAVQALIDAGELDPSFADGVFRYIERRNKADGFAQVTSAVTGIDSGLARIVGLVLAGVVDHARSNTRKERLGTAWAAMTKAGFELVDHGWNALVRRCANAGLLLREAAELRAVEARVTSLQQQLEAQQQSRDGSFEQTLSLVLALEREHPHSASVQGLVQLGEQLAEVRAHLLGSWLTRFAIGMEEGAHARAQQHFMRLYPGDSVLAFFATTVFGQGKAGLVLTSASVQWLAADGVSRRLGYAQLRPEHVSWSGNRLQLGDHGIDLQSDTDAQAAGRALQGCLRLLAVRPGPPACVCGAPKHWMEFGPDAAHCPSCRASVGYS